MSTIIAQQGQTIADIAIQEYGSVEYIKNVIQANDVGLNDDLSGVELTINSTGIGDEKVKEFILLNNIKTNNNFDSVLEIINFVFEDDDNFIVEDGNNFILE